MVKSGQIKSRLVKSGEVKSRQVKSGKYFQQRLMIGVKENATKSQIL